MDKQKVITEIEKMSDKNKAKIVSIILEELDINTDTTEFGAKIIEVLNSAVRWLN